MGTELPLLDLIGIYSDGSPTPSHLLKKSKQHHGIDRRLCRTCRVTAVVTANAATTLGAGGMNHALNREVAYGTYT